MGIGKKRLSVQKIKYQLRKKSAAEVAKSRGNEKLLENIRIAKKKDDPEYKEIAKEKDRVRKQKMREDKEYRETERKRDNVEKRIKREHEDYREPERERDKVEKQRKREDEEYRETERERDNVEKQRKREDENYREIERERDKVEKQRKREDEECREIKRERDKVEKQRKREDEECREIKRERDKVEKQTKREDEHYRGTERERDKVEKQRKREDEECREIKRERDKVEKQTKREDEHYRETERERDKVEKQRKREDEECREIKRERDKVEKQTKREDEHYRETERERDKVEKQTKREDEHYRETERERDTVEKQRKREDEEYRETERERDKVEKQRKREDEQYRETERERDKVQKQRKREDEEYRESERERDKIEKEIKRRDKSFREAERAKDRVAKERLRVNKQVLTQKRLADKRNKTELRNNDIYRYREQYVNTLQRQETNKYAVAKLNFIRSLSDLPNFVCACCEGLFFRNYVVSFVNSALKTTHCIGKSSQQLLNFIENINNTPSEYVCKTCHKHIKNLQIPKLSTSNGLKFIDVPSCITDLTDLEERMVSPYINFMQIRPLKPYAIHPQLSLKGSIVNIAVDVQDMLKILPRSFSDMNVIQVKLKRHVEHKSDYMFESIRPAYVCRALKHLLDTPLYKKYDIKVDQSFFNQYELSLDSRIAFIVNPEDIEQESQCEDSEYHKTATAICVDDKHLTGNIEFDSESFQELVMDRKLSDISVSGTETLFERMSIEEDTNLEIALAEIETPSSLKDIVQPLIADDESMSSVHTVAESMSIEDDSDLERALAEIDSPPNIKDDVESTSDADDDGEKLPDDEVLIMDRNKEVSEISKIQVIAPGQGKAPVPWHIVEDIDELSFPRIFGGHGSDLKKYNISYSERCKSEARRKDRRSCRPTRLLYMAKQKLERSCLSSVNICLRKINRTEKLTAGEARNKNFINDMVRYDAGYRVLNQVRSSPSYWESKKKHLLAMIRQLGTPTFFLTISSAEKLWPELMQGIYEIIHNRKLNMEEVLKMSDNEKCELIKLDPVTCARYFDHRVRKLLEYIKSDGGPFDEYKVLDCYERVEFQARGSPHEHIFLWLQNAPSFSADSADDERIIQFIDRFITCHYDEKNPNISLQRHKHTDTCYKGRKHKKSCRFQFPKEVMPRTMILIPLDKASLTDNVERDREKIDQFTQQMYKHPILIDFDQILRILEMTEERYILAIRSKLSRNQIFLRRTSLEVGINGYNPDVLNLMGSNMDLQFVLDPYSCASYVINYVTKIDAGLTKLLKEAGNDVAGGNIGIKDRLKNVANVFINGNIMSAQEAAYHILGLSLSKSSRGSVFVNTSPLSERVRMLKSNAALQELPDDSKDIYLLNIHEKYSKRQQASENICLADYATAYKPRKCGTTDSSCEGSEDEESRESSKNRILRYRRYKYDQDPLNYYREQMLLFLPWRNELEEIENVDHEDLYHKNVLTIEQNRKKYCILSEDDLDRALEEAQREKEPLDENEIKEFEVENVPAHQQVDILEQGGQAKKSKIVIGNRFTVPQTITYEKLADKMRLLNRGQRSIVMHVLHCFKSGKTPLHIFLSGSAGVGKSTVINTIYQSLTLYFNNIPGNQPDKLRVLLCAPSGKAAFLIGGVTLHTAFALPVSQFGGQMPELSADIANTIREKLFDLKLLIIDEISMVGARLLSRVDTRLRQIMGVDERFGGISLLVVGDLLQLPPVMDKYVFEMPGDSKLSTLVDSPLWASFYLYELTEIMRQKDEFDFIVALNNLAMGKMTEQDVKLIKSRTVLESDVPDSAIRLYANNELVNRYNNAKIKKMPGEEHVSIADDVIRSAMMDKGKKKKLLASLKSKKMIETGGLPHALSLKIGIKYMISINLDVEDGLVNGACGTLRQLTFSDDGGVNIIWLEFPETRVGKISRSKSKNFSALNDIASNLVPIVKHSSPINMPSTLHAEIIRKQFPVIPAEALTIHKSQGQTYPEVSIDFTKRQRFTRCMLYVALSRVCSLSGLYIVGNFQAPLPPKFNDPVINEMKKLKEQRRMSTLSEFPFNTYQVKIFYQNVRSLRKHIDDIKCDAWYNNADVLIVSETNTISTDKVEISGYKLICRTDKDAVQRKQKGVMCFAKNDIDITIISCVHVEDKSDEDRYLGHIDLIDLTYKGIHVITGYRSPDFSSVKFDLILKDLSSRLLVKNTVFLGDFNFDIAMGKSNKLRRYLIDHELVSALPQDSYTTDMSTQIDVIFTNIPQYHAGVYETYFSDHKPIYFLARPLENAGMLDNIEPGVFPKRITQKVIVECVQDNTCIPIKIKNIPQVESKREQSRIVKRKPQKTDKFFESNTRLNTPETQQVLQWQRKDIRNDGSKFPLGANEKQQILSATEELQDIVINRFGEILTNFSNQESDINVQTFRHQDVLFCQMPQYIDTIPQGIPNIQILFGEGYKQGAVGHWVCAYYDGTQLHIYDSMNPGTTTYEYHRIYLEKLHPYITKPIHHRVQQQPDNVTCGLFAIAFAVSIYFGDNPEHIRYNVAQMREHLWRIFQENRLIRFPSM